MLRIIAFCLLTIFAAHADASSSRRALSPIARAAAFNNQFTVATPANGATVSNIIQIAGIAGDTWANVAAFSGSKLTNDDTPSAGAYSLSFDTRQLADGSQTISVIAFSVPPGKPDGTFQTINITLNISNGAGPVGPFYVATTGNDTANNCTNSGSPCLTINHAEAQVTAKPVIIHVAAGSGYAPATLNQSGTSAVNTVTTICDGARGTCVIDGGGTTNDCVTISATSYNIFNGFKVQNCKLHGILLTQSGSVNSTNNQIINNEVVSITNAGGTGGAGGQGITDTEVAGAASNIIAANYVHGNGAASDTGNDNGIQIIASGDLVYNNVVSAGFGNGIILNPTFTATNNTVLNNTIINVSNGDGIQIAGASGSFSNLLAENNITYGGSAYGLAGCNAHGTIVEKNNISWNNPASGGQLQNYALDHCAAPTATFTYTLNYQFDPLFTNPATTWTLQTGTPAVYEGIGSTGITTDFAGNTRYTIPTIGAYEYVSAQTAAPAPSGGDDTSALNTAFAARSSGQTLKFGTAHYKYSNLVSIPAGVIALGNGSGTIFENTLTSGAANTMFVLAGDGAQFINAQITSDYTAGRRGFFGAAIIGCASVNFGTSDCNTSQGINHGVVSGLTNPSEAGPCIFFEYSNNPVIINNSCTNGQAGGPQVSVSTNMPFVEWNTCINEPEDCIGYDSYQSQASGAGAIIDHNTTTNQGNTSSLLDVGGNDTSGTTFLVTNNTQFSGAGACMRFQSDPGFCNTGAHNILIQNNTCANTPYMYQIASDKISSGTIGGATPPCNVSTSYTNTNLTFKNNIGTGISFYPIMIGNDGSDCASFGGLPCVIARNDNIVFDGENITCAGSNPMFMRGTNLTVQNSTFTNCGLSQGAAFQQVGVSPYGPWTFTSNTYH